MEIFCYILYKNPDKKAIGFGCLNEKITFFSDY